MSNLFEQIAEASRPKFTVSYLMRSGIYDGPLYKTVISGNDLAGLLEIVGSWPIVSVTKNF